jgi:outer membrane protein TolC
VPQLFVGDSSLHSRNDESIANDGFKNQIKQQLKRMMLKVHSLIITIVLFCFFCDSYASGQHQNNNQKRKQTPVLHTIQKNQISTKSRSIEQHSDSALSLDEAILLAVRSNPNVQSSRLSYLAQKFSLWIQEWEFLPHYALTAEGSTARNGTPGQPLDVSHHYNATPAVSLLTPYGTSMILTATNTITGHYNPGLSLRVLQPLLRGFGRPVVEASLNNARESEVISRLNIEGTLRSTVSEIIDAYLNVVSAERTVGIDEQTVQRTQTSLHQTQLFIKAGHKAGNEMVTVQANVASAQTALENDRNNLIQARYALLAAIGVDPNANLHFSSLNLEELIKKYRLPDLSKAKQLILENDIQYQTDLITLHGQRSRDLMIAKDNSRWQLNLTANAATGNGSGGGYNAGIDSVFNGKSQSTSVGLELTIPIDDQQAKQAVLNAKIGLKQAELALEQERWSKETSAINGWNNVVSAERALRFAIDAEKWQEKTYNLNYQKYLHGLIDSLELQSALQSLSQAQQASLSARINYLKSLVSLDLLTGNTLKTWNVEVRTT